MSTLDDASEVTREAHRCAIDEVLALAAGEVEGLHGPKSLTWRLSRENVHFLGGIRALLLQIAHPDVAHGVRQYSQFQRDPFGRAIRTFSTVLDLTFGDLAHAREAALRVWAVHDRVRGARNDGVAYIANHGPALFWVFATLVDGIVTTYPLFVGPLTPDDLDRYWSECRVSAQLFGIPSSLMPERYSGFRAYMDAMLAGPLLRVDEVTREVARAVFDLKVVPPPARQVVLALTVGLTPERFRSEFGLAWGWRERLAYRASVELVRRTLPFLPALFRYNPQALLADWRCRLARFFARTAA